MQPAFFFLLDDSPASEIYTPTLRQHSVCSIIIDGVSWNTICEDGTRGVFLNVGTLNSDAGESSKSKNKYPEHGKSLKQRIM